MCGVCGCGQVKEQPFARIEPVQEGVGVRRRSTVERIDIEQAVLAHNDQNAARNRQQFAAEGLTIVNLMGSPGAGKTSLLEALAPELGGQRELYVIEGDQAASHDAERLQRLGVPVVQVNTGRGCHLEATNIQTAIAELRPQRGALVFVENVGNLVCPALFDLGEEKRVVVASTTEGDDKPSKYPHMFRSADLIVLSKVDLLPHVRFDVERFRSEARACRPKVPIIEVSATAGTGIPAIVDWAITVLA